MYCPFAAFYPCIHYKFRYLTELNWYAFFYLAIACDTSFGQFRRKLKSHLFV